MAPAAPVTTATLPLRSLSTRREPRVRMTDLVQHELNILGRIAGKRRAARDDAVGPHRGEAADIVFGDRAINKNHRVLTQLPHSGDLLRQPRGKLLLTSGR